MPLYLDDLEDGWKHSFGRIEVRRDEVIDFARRFDPQDFHLDDDAAAIGPFGTLTASGWHTAAMGMRMIVDEWSKLGMRSLGSPGIEAINFLKPVRPGDVLTSELELLDRRPSNSRPDRVIARIRQALRNQNNDVVFTARHICFFPRKPA